jgi:periplasmic protein TonB
VSVAVHIAAALLIVLLPRVLPREAQPPQQGTVELLMVEQKGAEPSQAGQPKESPPAPKPPDQAAAAKAEDRKEPAAPPSSKATPEPPAADNGDEPVPPPTEQTEAKAVEPTPPPVEKETPPEKEAKIQPAPPQSQDAPVFDFAGTGSESNATALGRNILPAAPDDRFRNRPPIYPDTAAMRGEQGSVVVDIHISEDGVATGVDVLKSSGSKSLDQAAVTAIRKWRFHPALKDGQTVPSEMQFEVTFEDR